MSAKKKTGAPSHYTEKTAGLICELIASGESLNRICKAVEGMPDKATVFRWMIAHSEFRDNYARAKEIQAELMAEELLEIADDKSDDVSGELKLPNSVAVQRSKLQVDTRKWIASKLLPKKYGDKLAHTGPDGEGPVQAEITVKFVGSNGSSNG